MTLTIYKFTTVLAMAKRHLFRFGRHFNSLNGGSIPNAGRWGAENWWVKTLVEQAITDG